jgi:hypothetical protein
VQSEIGGLVGGEDLKFQFFEARWRGSSAFEKAWFSGITQGKFL